MACRNFCRTPATAARQVAFLLPLARRASSLELLKCNKLRPWRTATTEDRSANSCSVCGTKKRFVQLLEIALRSKGARRKGNLCLLS